MRSAESWSNCGGSRCGVWQVRPARKPTLFGSVQAGDVTDDMLYLTKDFCTSLFQSGNNSFHIFNNKCNMPNTQGICKRSLNTFFI
jgi:hypothetical protein